MKIAMTLANLLLIVMSCLATVPASATESSGALNRPLRIGIYQGTFDPATLGHLGIARRAAEAAGLDLVYVVPVITNAKKPNAVPYNLRLHMARLAFQELPQARFPDSQLEHAFTLERGTGVMRTLLARHPGAQLFKITGDDVISKNYTPIMRTEPEFKDIGLIIGVRKGATAAQAEDLRSFDFGSREVIVIKEGDEAVSSTLTKKLISEGAPTNSVPLKPEVLNFINAHGLYGTGAISCEKLFPALAG